MSTQAINFGEVENCNFNGNEVEKVYLNDTLIWEIIKETLLGKLIDESFDKNLTAKDLEGITKVAPYSFYGCNLSSIELPNGVTSIENGAFGECYSLSNIIIPNSVVSVGNNAFENCALITSLNLPNITSIPQYLFSWTGVTSFDVGNKVTEINFLAFQYAAKLTTLTFLPTTPPTISGSTTLAIPSSVTTVYVPTNSLEQYKTATGYGNLVDKMVGV